jgi:L-lactate dehydrogenase complex protein LldG
MSNDARSRILERLGRAGPWEAPEVAPAPARAFRDPAEKVRRFTARMEGVRAEVWQVSAFDWPARLLALCAAKGIRSLLHGTGGPVAEALPSAFANAPSTTLVPYEDTVETWKERLFFDTDAAVTSCRGAIAETGTLILSPTPEEPRLMSLVPPVHFAVLNSSDLHATFEEALLAQNWAAGLPTNALLISGPSKSADIEQTLAYGVHGPKELIVLLVS